MFTGSHVILYSSDADADRAFIQDVLGFGSVDAGGGWLIFKLPPAELAFHPTDGAPNQELYLMCEDIDALLDQLDSKGVVISREVTEARWGRLAAIPLPSGATLGVYQPLHPTAYDLPG